MVRCAVTPNDGTVSGTAAASNTVTIRNTAPTATAVSISPSVATTNDTLTATASGTDGDGDPVSFTYAWSVNGTAASTGSTLSGATYFGKNDLVTVVATPTDGFDTGSTLSASRTIANTPPGAPTAAIDPYPYADSGTDELLCELLTAGSDVDGDSLTYAVSWEVDGLPYPASFTGVVGPDTTTWTDDTVPADDTDLGVDWVCTLTPDDGDDTGTSATAATEAHDFYDVGYSAAVAGPGLAGASYLLGPSVTLTANTTIYAMGAHLNTAGNSARMALYTNSAGVPGTLVAYTDVFTTVVGANESSLSTPVAVSAGTYWLLAVYSASTYIYYGSSTLATVKYRSASYSSTPSTSYGTASSYTGYPPAYYLVVADH